MNANKTNVPGPHNLLRAAAKTVVDDLAVVKTIVDADPFAATVSGLREIYMAAVMIHKSAETGKGHTIARKRLPVLVDSVIGERAFVDATGTLQSVYLAALDAVKGF